MKKIIFINSHPIQYFAPLYQFLNQQGLPTACWYCSKETLQKKHVDKQFNTSFHWDVPLLEGYEYKFFPNYSWRPSLYRGFFGLFNPTLVLSLFKEPKSIVVVHGWGYLTHMLVIIFAKLAGHTVCLRGENPLNQQLVKSSWNTRLKFFLFKVILRPCVTNFLYIGSQNKAFYQYFGVPEKSLLFAPYAVDNHRFQQFAEAWISKRKELREALGLPIDRQMILYTAKFIGKKRPVDLLRAYQRINRKDIFLVMVGEGELRSEMEDFMKQNELKGVYLPGFKNQQEIMKYYAAADCFVLCSGEGETWGLSVNEAMSFDLPVVVSKTAGCSSDLVEQGTNGYVFAEGNSEQLSICIQEALKLSGNLKSDCIQKYSFETIAQNLKSIVIV